MLGLLVLILLVVGMPQFTSDSLAGAGCNGGNCTDFDAVNTSAGYYVDDVQVIDGSGDIVSGSITTTDAVSVGAFTQDGGVTATTTTGTAVTLVASDFDTENVIKVNSGTPGLTVTFPASSTLTALVPNVGDTREVWLYGASTSASANITIAAGAGTTLKKAASTTAQIVGDTDGLNNFRITFQRITAGGNILMDIIKHED